MRIIAAVTLVFLPGTFVATFFSTSFWDFKPDSAGPYVSTWVWLYWALTAVLTVTVLGFWQVFPKLKEAKEQNASIWQLVLESWQQHLVILKFRRREKVEDEEALPNPKDEHLDFVDETELPKRESRWRSLRKKRWLNRGKIQSKIITKDDGRIIENSIRQSLSEFLEVHSRSSSQVDPEDENMRDGEQSQREIDESNDTRFDKVANGSIDIKESTRSIVSSTNGVSLLHSSRSFSDVCGVNQDKTQQEHPVWTGT